MTVVPFDCFLSVSFCLLFPLINFDMRHDMIVSEGSQVWPLCSYDLMCVMIFFYVRHDNDHEFGGKSVWHLFP